MKERTYTITQDVRGTIGVVEFSFEKGQTVAHDDLNPQVLALLVRDGHAVVSEKKEQSR